VIFIIKLTTKSIAKIFANVKFSLTARSHIRESRRAFGLFKKEKLWKKQRKKEAQPL